MFKPSTFNRMARNKRKPLIPPKTIEDRYSDWKDFLRKILIGARHLPLITAIKQVERLKSRFEYGLNLEVESQVKVAIVNKIFRKN